MSTALIYRAFRATPLSHEESQAIDIVIARYQSDFEYRDEADAIQSDPPDPADPERICSGAIVLTDAAEDGRHWADCLTDIRRLSASPARSARPPSTRSTTRWRKWVPRLST